MGAMIESNLGAGNQPFLLNQVQLYLHSKLEEQRQTTGKVRLSVHPEAHEGLGVSCYAWMTSPLRRYVDLLNQWQLVAAVRGERPPFNRNSEGLLASLRDSVGKIQILNPSEDVREVLEITKLNQIFDVRDEVTP